MHKLPLFVAGIFLLVMSISSAARDDISPRAVAPRQQPDHAGSFQGILFSCKPDRIREVKAGVEKYLASLGIRHPLYHEIFNINNGILNISLRTPERDNNTLNLQENPEFAIQDEHVYLPGEHGISIRVETVSRKEILLALMQHGRLTTFADGNCSVQALKDHVGIRQNIVVWAENLNWDWPDGDYAKWNTRYWHKGTPLPGVKISRAFADAFSHQNDYSIGCYTATKLVFVQGILDYYSRINKNRKLENLIEDRLELDHDPLAQIEPGKMWSFESDFDPHDMTQAGKLLQVQRDVATKNFVPGDWIYLLNTDPVSSQKTGYEGSNAIYMGRNKFDDYYDDNNHSFTYQQKLDEVYQWRNGVFSRSRDYAKIRPLTSMDFERLSDPPDEGGLTIAMRAYPYQFSGGKLPSMTADASHADSKSQISVQHE